MYDLYREVAIINQSFMSWIIVFLLILIIILLSVCVYLDVQLAMPSSTPTETTGAPSADSTASNPQNETTAPPTTTAPPITTLPPTTTLPPATTTPPTTTTPPITTEAPVTTQKPLDPNAPTVCIDPGHGFTDPGAVAKYNGKEVYEKDINFAISLMLAEELNALGYNVIFTHDGKNLPDDKYLYVANEPLVPFDASGRSYWIYDRRTSIDLVVSIHCNTSSYTSVSGTRCYILPSNLSGYNAKSVTLAKSLIASFQKTSGISPQSSYQTQDLGVLKSGLPGVLVESAFMTNQGDLQKLMNETWQRNFAKAIAQGVDDYLT